MFWMYCASRRNGGSRQRPYQDAHCPHSPCERQIKEANHQLDALTVKLIPAEDAVRARQQEQHDVEILASLPGVGGIVLATLLTEAWDTAITPLCAVWPESRLSPRSPARAASSSGGKPAATGSPTPCAIGRALLFSMTRTAMPSAPPCAPGVIAMAAPSDRSPIASPMAPAPC
jgi:hypothetical protein